jgi:hypothetical protein
MPKKKLTKAQVKKKLKTITTNMTDLLIDKLGHADSFVNMSSKKLLDISADITRASARFR